MGLIAKLKLNTMRPTMTEAERLQYLNDRQKKQAVSVPSWCPPALTPEQQKEQDEYVKKWNLPF